MQRDSLFDSLAAIEGGDDSTFVHEHLADQSIHLQIAVNDKHQRQRSISFKDFAVSHLRVSVSPPGSTVEGCESTSNDAMSGQIKSNSPARTSNALLSRRTAVFSNRRRSTLS